jgi:hypothetical protein
MEQRRVAVMPKKKKTEESRNSDIMTSHCVVPQEDLCSKSFPGFQHVLSVVTKGVNFILSKGLDYRQFQNLLNELRTRFGDLVSYSEVQ